MWNGLVGVAKETYTASLGEGVVPRPLMMPLVRGELVGLNLGDGLAGPECDLDCFLAELR